MTDLHISQALRFSFGLPAHSATSTPIEPWDFVYGLAEVGAWGMAASDDQFVTPNATPHERDDLIDKLQAAVNSTGIAVSAIATEWRCPAFTDGALSSAAGEVRRLALGKAMRALDLGVELGASLHLLSSGYPRAAGYYTSGDALDRYREAVDFLCGYARDHDYSVRFAVSPGTRGRNADALLPTVSDALAFIETLENPAMVGLSVRPSAQPARDTCDGVANAAGSGRLAQIDLSVLEADGDLGFGAGSLKETFFLVRTLEEVGFPGPRHLGAVACHSDDGCAWDFAAGYMRTYAALAAKARRFGEDPDIQAALADQKADASVGPYSRQAAETIAGEACDPDALIAARTHHGRLDQLTTDLLLGLR